MLQADVLLLATVAGGLLAILLGALLLLQPAWLERVLTLSLRSSTLDRSYRIEHWFYRHNRVLGALIALAGLYMLAHFGLLLDRAQLLAGIARRQPFLAGSGLLDALVLAALLGGVLVLWFGLNLGLRPSLLREVEEESNRWISGDQARLAHYMLHHARMAGSLLMGCGGALLAAAAWAVL